MHIFLSKPSYRTYEELDKILHNLQIHTTNEFAKLDVKVDICVITRISTLAIINQVLEVIKIR